MQPPHPQPPQPPHPQQPQPYPPQPYAAPYALTPTARPPRPGWGRFWLGVLAGGCGVLVVEALALLVLLVVLGSAISSALRGQSGSGALPGVPGGLPLPSGLPGIAQRSDPCSPQPCMAHSGLTVLVSDVQRDAGPATGGAGAHVVQLGVTFVSTSGTHNITPEEVVLRDASGSMVLAGAGGSSSDCADATVSRALDAGQRAGPYVLCYAAGGSANAPLTLVWIDPEDLSIVELTLP